MKSFFLILWFFSASPIFCFADLFSAHAARNKKESGFGSAKLAAKAGFQKGAGRGAAPPLKAADGKDPIVIGSKIFTESAVLGEALALLLEEKYGQPVKRRLHLGGTQLVFEALNSGQIDVYPEYTGTGYIMILKRSEKRSPEEIYQEVSRAFLKRFGMKWSLPLGFENTYGLAVRAGDPRFKDVKKISSLRGRGQKLSLAAGHEFMERGDGFDQFVKLYGLRFPEDQVHAMNSGLMYAALKSKKTDMIMSYSTDGRIKAFGFRLLEDDLEFFPSYQAAYLTRASVLESSPELALAFKDLEGKISQAEMTALNEQTDRLKRDPARAARSFLIKKGLLSAGSISAAAPDQAGPGRQSLWSYYLSKKRYFFRIFAEHLILTVSALALALALALPLGIYSARKPLAAKIVFPFVNTMQTIPGLALLGFCVPFFGIGYAAALIALFVYSVLPLMRSAYEGVKRVERDFVEAALAMGLTKWQILRRVELPIAMPFLIAGFRTSAVIVVGTATLAALVGAGGLGDPIFRGIATMDSRLIFLGAAPAALLAAAVDRALGFAERALVSPGLQLRQNLQK